MARKYFYRVTKIDNSSWFVIDDRANVFCKKNKWCYPKIKGSKLYVMDTIEHAEALVNSYDRIWKCVVKNPKRRYKGLSGHSLNATTSNCEKNIIDFWKNKVDSYKCARLMYDGVYIVDAFKPIEEIKI